MPTDIQKIIDEISLPAVEIAGPSPRGYKILDELSLTIPPIQITNLARNVTVFTSDDKPQSHTVDSVVDFRRLPYGEESLGILLCSYLPSTDYPSSNTPSRTDEEVEAEYKSVLAGQNKPELSLNFHIKLMSVAYTTLAAGGILLLQGVHPKDTAIAQMINFTSLLSAKEERHTDCQIYFKQISTPN